MKIRIPELWRLTAADSAAWAGRASPRLSPNKRQNCLLCASVAGYPAVAVWVQIESSLLSSLSSGSPGFVRRRLWRHGRCERCRGA
jgi:hypothetical protein